MNAKIKINDMEKAEVFVIINITSENHNKDKLIQL